MALGLGLIIAIILFKYKPTYVVSLCGEQIGYVSNAAELQNRIQSEIIDMDGENIDFVTLDNMPKYELKLVEKSLTTNEDEIMLALKDDAKVMYKYYAVILNAETITYVDNIEEAEEAVEQIKEEHKDDTIQLDLAVTTNYTENINEIGIQSVEVAKQEVEQKVDILIDLRFQPLRITPLDLLLMETAKIYFHTIAITFAFLSILYRAHFFFAMV